MEIENLPRLKIFKKVLQISCEMQLMGPDTLNQQHIMQCYAAIILIFYS